MNLHFILIITLAVLFLIDCGLVVLICTRLFHCKKVGDIISVDDIPVTNVTQLSLMNTSHELELLKNDFRNLNRKLSALLFCKFNTVFARIETPFTKERYV
jgi:hypothetical protein